MLLAIILGGVLLWGLCSMCKWFYHSTQRDYKKIKAYKAIIRQNEMDMYDMIANSVKNEADMYDMIANSAQNPYQQHPIVQAKPKPKPGAKKKPATTTVKKKK